MEMNEQWKQELTGFIYEMSGDESCGCCGGYHPKWFVGDCRDDANRYHPEDLAEGWQKAVNCHDDLICAILGLLEILDECECDNTHKQNQTA